MTTRYQKATPQSAAFSNEIMPTTINTFNEGPLHAELKRRYAEPGDEFEQPVNGYIIDIVRGDLLIEIQTGNFAKLKAKLHALLTTHPVRLVYPVACEKWLVKLPAAPGAARSRRKSPKRGSALALFDELVSFPQLLAHANFTIEVLLIHEEEIRRYDSARAWRRKGWATEERRLLEIVGRQRFETPAELATLLPAGLTEPFTVAALAEAAGITRRLAGKMAYCLHKTGVLEQTGKQGRASLYQRVSA